MSAQVIPFIYNDKPVRSIERNGEPWFVGKDVCAVLDLTNTAKSIERLDDDEKGITSVYTHGGSQEMIIISEAGVYRLVFTSRKKEAEDFKRWLAHEVLPQLRKTGKFAVDKGEAQLQRAAEDTIAAQRMKIDMVNAARATHGQRYAQALWFKIGLPDVRTLELGPLPRDQEPLGALNMLLDAALPPDGLDDTGMADLRNRIERAFDDEEARLSLIPLGIKIYDDPEGFVVSNTSRFITSVFEGTEWSWRRWQRTLRRLPGAHAAKTRFGDLSARGTFIPAELLDVRCPS
jgi:prophage antirepressor-like protein